jgi:hypothetical protein
VVEIPIKGMSMFGHPQSEYMCKCCYTWIANCTCHDWQDKEVKV